ncbi:MAG: hypothetical protein IKC35_02850 [Clostridia bacterium]|nr:hypothetical protein [Clostridia bacterium]
MGKMVDKTNKLGNLALIFSFAIPALGLILGIVAIVVGAKEDTVLRNDGIKAVIFSVLTSVIYVVLVLTILMLVGILPFIIPTLGA